MESLEVLEINDKKQLKKFYKLWSSTLSSKIKKYAQENSLSWYNVKWKNKSKEIPFYIRPQTRSAFGGVWFASSPVNYAFGKGVQKFSDKYKKFPKRTKIKPVHSNGRWFTPKRFKPDVKGLDSSISELKWYERVFASKTSHGKTHKYKRPLLWGQEKGLKTVTPIFLKDQLSDYLINDPEIEKLILESFEETVKNKAYL